MSAPELKPCPFCGGEAEATNYVIEASVACKKCDATITKEHGQYDDTGYDAAIVAWNTRADLCDPTQDERVRALVKAAEAQLDYMDMCNDAGDLERNLRAALRALEQG